MSAPNLPMKPQSSVLKGHETRPMVSRTNSAPFLVAPRRVRPLRIAVIGNHLPRQCGIATFTTDLCNAIAAESAASELMVVAVNDAQSSYDYPLRVRYAIAEGEPSSYQGAAEFLNSAKVDVVCLQHEFGIFGGKAGRHVLRLLQHLEMPVVTTLHTVLREPNIDQRLGHGRNGCTLPSPCCYEQALLSFSCGMCIKFQAKRSPRFRMASPTCPLWNPMSTKKRFRRKERRYCSPLACCLQTRGLKT